MTHRRAAFFFGSGISRASGASDVVGITDKLLRGPWKSHTDWRFYPRSVDEEQVSTGLAWRAQEFLTILKNRIDPHLRDREGREAHYEDLYSAVRQIVQDETAEVTNPLLADTVAAIKRDSESLCRDHSAHIDDNALASLAARSADLVQWAVYFGLNGAREPKGLEVITETACAVGELDVFTLNHDLLVETQLRRAGHAMFDGFGNKRGDVRVFDGSWPSPAPAIRLFKLHGSINWFCYRFQEWDQYAVVDGDFEHAKDERGKYLSLLEPSPMFLTGTTVKEQVYGHGLFGELFLHFRSRLSMHRTLICCGYGWSDKGINIRLNQWLRDAQENRLVVLHPDWDSELQAKRFWRNRWERYRDAGKVIVVPKWLKDCGLADLEPYLD